MLNAAQHILHGQQDQMFSSVISGCAFVQASLESVRWGMDVLAPLCTCFYHFILIRD